MKITRKDIRQIVISLIVVITIIIISGEAWLDQKRENLLKFEQQVTKEKIELEVTKQQLKEKKKKIENLKEMLRKKERKLNEKKKKLASEKLLNFYILTYISKYGDIDIHKECLSNKKYMERYRKAKALLDIIEAKAKELGKKDILEKFIWPRRNCIHTLSVRCKNCR